LSLSWTAGVRGFVQMKTSVEATLLTGSKSLPAY
jgi:hypothetical protein